MRGRRKVGEVGEVNMTAGMCDVVVKTIANEHEEHVWGKKEGKRGTWK